jgi:hypothetical protein
MMAKRGEKKKDDLLQKVTVSAVQRWLNGTGFRIVQEKRQLSGFFSRRVPRFLRQLLERNRISQNVIYNNLEYLLMKPESGTGQMASRALAKDSWVRA